MNLRPLRDRLVVREILPPNPAGLVLLGRPHDPGFVKEAVYGEVLAIGPGRDRHGMWGLEVGDQIAYSPVNAYKTDDGTVVQLGSVMGKVVQ